MKAIKYCSAANKDRSTDTYHQSLAFDCPYLSCNDHGDRCFSKKSIFIIFRSSRTQMFFKKGVIGNFAIFTSVLESLFNKVYFNLVPKETSTQVFSVKIANTFFMEHLRWLLLLVWKSNCSIMTSICQPFLNQKQKMWDGFYYKGL